MKGWAYSMWFLLLNSVGLKMLYLDFSLLLFTEAGIPFEKSSLFPTEGWVSKFRILLDLAPSNRFDLLGESSSSLFFVRLIALSFLVV